MANSTKTTKRDYFNLIISALADNKEIVDFCKHEIELLDNRKAKASTESKTAKENAPLCADIYNTLISAGTRMTFAEIKAVTPSVSALSPQKLTAIVSPYVASGLIVKEIDKKITYWVGVKAEAEPTE